MDQSTLLWVALLEQGLEQMELDVPSRLSCAVSLRSCPEAYSQILLCPWALVNPAILRLTIGFALNYQQR